MPPLPCMLVCASIYLLHTRPRVQRAPGIPCALDLEGKEIRWQASGRWSREIVKLCHPPAVIIRLVRNCALERMIQYPRDGSD